MSLDADDLREIIEDFMTEATEMLEQLDQDLVSLEENAQDQELINRIFRNMHTIKGTANFLQSEPAFVAMGKVAHAAEDAMGELRSGKLSMSPSLLDAVLETVDIIKDLFEDVRQDHETDYDPAPLVSKLRSFIEPEQSKSEPKPKVVLTEEQLAMLEGRPLPKKEEPKPKVVLTEEQLAMLEGRPLPKKEENKTEVQLSPEQLAMLEGQSQTSDESGLDEEDIKEIVDDFVAESTEMLEQLDQDLVALEENAQDQELINRIFRNMHTIKGTANFLTMKPNFAVMGQVAHAAEDVMGGLREGKMALTGAIMDAVLESVDVIKELFAACEEKQPTYNPTPLVDKLRQFFSAKQKTEKSLETISAGKQETTVADDQQQTTTKSPLTEVLTEEDRQELLQDFLEESRELVENIDNILLKLEKNTDQPTLIDEVFRCVHTLKGTSAFLGFNNVSALAHAVEDVLKEIRRNALALGPHLMDILLKIVDIWKRFFQKSKPRDIAKSPFIEEIKKIIGTPELPSATIPKPEPPIPVDTQKRVDTKRVAINKTRKFTSRTEQTIRVEANRLNKLMNLGGELVLGRNRLAQVVQTVIEKFGEDKLCQDLQAAVDFINFVTADLQMAVLKTRMQPIGKIFNRFNRTVRDLARELGKEITLVIQGADTELDKSMIDELGDPLTHLLRNAVDHGIETPEQRAKSAKSANGTIHLSAFQEGNQIVIELSDDGKGIDRNAVLKKALSQGIITEQEARHLPDQQIHEFIFAPGFSTAAQVTSVSGRGVGMDVVKNNIEKLNGSIELESEEGKGSTFKLKFPLTLATIQALQVKIHEEVFALPLSSVIETMRLYSHQIQTISGKPVISFRDSVIPIIYLEDVFEMKEKVDFNKEQIYIVIAGIAEKKIGIVVDKIIRREEIVIKSLGKLLDNIPGISGACIGGDGRVILILDIASLLRILPRNVVMAGVKALPRTSIGSSKGKAPCIMVVEDSRSERKRIRMLMESQGYKVLEAADGKDALAKLVDHHINMVITDIEMPALDGYQLTAKIREHRKYQSIPVIAVSSHKEMVDRIKGMEVGINSYLPKPLQEKELFDAVKNLFSMGN